MKYKTLIVVSRKQKNRRGSNGEFDCLALVAQFSLGKFIMEQTNKSFCMTRMLNLIKKNTLVNELGVSDWLWELRENIA